LKPHGRKGKHSFGPHDKSSRANADRVSDVAERAYDWSTHPDAAALNKRIQLLDDISHDVNALELYLDRSGFRMLVRSGDLAWAPTPGLKRWRIMWRGERPLIETPASVRATCMPALVKLLEDVGKEAAF
jgi:hypothetical protein